MKIIKSHILDEATRASRRWEDAATQMRQHWPEPNEAIVEEWNTSRRLAEEATARVLKEGR